MLRAIPMSLLIAALLTTSAHAQEATKTLRLASLEWQPYSGSQILQEGWLSFVVDSAARRFGYQASIDHFPWTRAMQIGQKDADYTGYFPAYYTEERARHCHFSQMIGSSTLGLAHLQSAPLSWQSLEDLARLRIAVVAGYSNGAGFDEEVRAGKLKVDAAPNDMLNLRKLLAHRVDAVVIDKRVLRHLLMTEPSVSQERDKIAFHPKPLAELSLHVCFQRSPAGREMQQAFNRALRSLPLARMEQDYFQRLERTPAPSRN
jgi:polar amino acid transport system substrate-binding protein